MSKLLPALQKFYNAVKHLNQFALESSFVENIGCLDTFLSEYRSTTFVLQKSLGGAEHPAYQKNLNEYLLNDKTLCKWFNDQRVEVIHNHPFYLKRILRVIIYDAGNAKVFKEYAHTIENDEPISDYLEELRNTFMAITSPEIYFSAQYLFTDIDDQKESNIFDLIERGVAAMWRFLHAMKVDLSENSEIENKLLKDIDDIVKEIPQRWIIDAMDYCYYRSDDRFERGQSFTMQMPSIRFPKSFLMEQAKQLNKTLDSFYDCFIYFHTYAYLFQNRNLLTTFFLEYEDGTYLTIAFTASLRTTMYRFINRVAEQVEKGDITSVYLATETVGYGDIEIQNFDQFLQLNYEEKKKYRTKDYLTFYMITIGGVTIPAIIDTDKLVDQLSISVAMGSMKTEDQLHLYDVMMTPIVEAFKKGKKVI